jgi:hypothetical protein
MKDQKKAGETFAWAVNFANKTPFETDEIVQATVKLQSYGIEAQKNLPFIGDMAAAMGKGIDQAAEAVADGLQGNLERLLEFGVTKEMIVQQANKKLNGIEVVNNKGQITNQKAFNLALFSLMQERYKGAMEIQSKSWGGLVSTISGIAKTGLAQISGIAQNGDIIKGSAFDIAKQKLTQLADAFTKLQESGKFDELQKKLSDLVSNGLAKVEEYVPKIIEFGQKVIDNGPQIIDTVEKIGIGFLTWKAIEGVANGIILISNLSKALSTLKTVYLASVAAKGKDALATLYLQGLYAKDAIIAGPGARLHRTRSLRQRSTTATFCASQSSRSTVRLQKEPSATWNIRWAWWPVWLRRWRSSRVKRTNCTESRFGRQSPSTTPSNTRNAAYKHVVPWRM